MQYSIIRTISGIARVSGRSGACLAACAVLALMPSKAPAQEQLPPPWAGADIGSPSPVGLSQYQSGVIYSYNGSLGGSFTVSGSGYDIWNTSDQFHYVYQYVGGDTTIQARVFSLANTDVWAKAGIMVRQSLAATSNFAGCVVTPSNGINFQYRNSANPSGGNAGTSGTVVTWLKLVRSGGNVTAYYAPNSGNSPGTWTQLGTTQPIATGGAYVGLCICSHNTTTLGTAQFDNVTVSNTQAASADSFVDSIGVNTHWDYTDEVYYTNYTAVKNALIALGVRHVRSGLNGRQQDLAASGIKSLVGVYPNDAGGPTWTSGNITGTLIPQIKAVNSPLNAIDGVEGPNEPDLFWPSMGFTYNGQGWSSSGGGGATLFMKDLYTALKNDPQTASIPVVAMPLGGTYQPGQNPLASAGLAPYVDYGCFHPYPGGNPFANQFSYDTIPFVGGAGGYWAWGGEPSGNMDEWSYSYDVYSPPFGNKPMYATETGYFTGTATNSVSQTAFAKYIPRLLMEYFRRGTKKTYLYELIDENTDAGNSEQNYGLLYNNVTPKPAYTALQSLIQLLAEPGVSPSFVPGSLPYSISVAPNGGYTMTELVHPTLLQKSNGSFYLVLYHEVANTSGYDTSGNKITGTSRDITPPAMATTISLPGFTGKAFVYSYDSNWQLQWSPLTVTGGQATVNIPDKVTVIQLDPVGGSIPNGIHTLTPLCATGSCLDANASGTANGTKVQIWSAGGAANQKWNFTCMGSNLYKIQPSYSSALALDVNGGGSANGTVVQLYQDNNTISQRWQPAAVTGGYTFTPQCATGARMDVSGGLSANGTQVQIYGANSTASQTWAVR